MPRNQKGPPFGDPLIWLPGLDTTRTPLTLLTECQAEQIEELEAEAKAEVEDLTEKWNALIDEVEEEEVRPRRTDVRLNLFALAWVPRWELMVGEQALSMPAFEPELV